MNGKPHRTERRGRVTLPHRTNAWCLSLSPEQRGGVNSDFLRKHGLDEHSHPMDWFNSLLPMTPEDNLYDLAVSNVKGNNKLKSLVS